MAAVKSGILFVPVTSGKGIGEYSRCLMLANKMRAHSADLPIRFVIARGSLFEHSCPYDTLLIEGSPTSNSAAICNEIKSQRPKVVVFDSTGRTNQLRAAKEVGAKVVFISSRSNKRKKGMRLHWLRLLDQHWHVQPRWVDGDLGKLESLKLRLMRHCDFHFLDSFFPPPSESTTDDAFAAVGLQPNEPFVLFASGGGGKRQKGPHAPSVFLAAAGQLSEKIPLRCVVVMGPAAAVVSDEQQAALKSVLVVPSLPSDQFISLLAQAQTAVIGGGSTIAQALALGRCCVAAPAGSDQPHRIEKTHRAGLLASSPTEVQALAEQAYDVVTNNERRSALMGTIARQKPVNGLVLAATLMCEMAELS